VNEVVHYSHMEEPTPFDSFLQSLAPESRVKYQIRVNQSVLSPSIAKNNLVFRNTFFAIDDPNCVKVYRFIALSSKKMIERGDAYDISTQVWELREM
jgi:hypothetical protein